MTEDIILAVDVGRKTGWALNIGGKKIYSSGEFTWNDYRELYDSLEAVLLKFGPTIIVSAIPTWRYRVILAQAKMLGVLNCLANTYKLPIVETTDVVCKKAVFGKGKVEKDEIMERYKEKSEHVADARMFAEWYRLSKGQSKSPGKSRASRKAVKSASKAG